MCVCVWGGGGGGGLRDWGGGRGAPAPEDYYLEVSYLMSSCFVYRNASESAA